MKEQNNLKKNNDNNNNNKNNEYLADPNTDGFSPLKLQYLK